MSDELKLLWLLMVRIGECYGMCGQNRAKGSGRSVKTYLLSISNYYLCLMRY